MPGYLAYIQVLDAGGGRPDNSLPQPPLGIWGPPQMPPGIWPPPPGGGGGQPPYPSTGPGFPTHPIAPGGGGPNYPSQGPGFPTHPIAGLPPGGPPLFPSQGPGFPTNPIYLPIQPPEGGSGGETKPPGMENLPPVLVFIPGIGWIVASPAPPMPDNTLPGGPPPRPDNTLPPGVDNTLPPTAQPKE